MSAPARKVALRPRLTIDQIQRMRATQRVWLGIADDPSIRPSARENARQQAERIDREIRYG